jgi:GxxExxY protein
MPYEDEDLQYGRLPEPPEEIDALARAVIGAAIEVHRRLGPGLPEAAYEGALAVELTERRIPFERQVIVDVVYKGVVVATGRIDMLVGRKLIVENKSCESISPIHRLQVQSYLRIIHQPLGLLINYNVPVLKDGIKRIVCTT